MKDCRRSEISYGDVRSLGDERLRVAVIGLGKMGLLHASILNVLPNVQVVAVCDKSVLLRKFLKKVFSESDVVDDLERLSGLGLDMVYVTTPISSHFPIVRTVYVNKIARNLFVEKTLASSYDKSEKLCELAQSFGGVNMVGYVRRFGVTYKKAKDLLVQEAVGELVSFKTYGYSSDFVESRNSSSVSSGRGGVLRDLGCYVIDLALWFFGDLQVTWAEVASRIGGVAEDSARFSVRQPSGLEGEFDVSWCVRNYRIPEVGFSIIGSKGVIKVNDDKLELKLNNGKSSVWCRHDLNDTAGFWLGGPEFYREDEYFVKSVADGCNAEPNFLTASKTDCIIGEIGRRAEKNEC